ncbi:MAG: hypothetical protein HQK52_19025 [Oligoflexia bacterium]|nr:hypothetical protein [Oligoflexia bacterium]
MVYLLPSLLVISLLFFELGCALELVSLARRFPNEYYKSLEQKVRCEVEKEIGAGDLERGGDITSDLPTDPSGDL